MPPPPANPFSQPFSAPGVGAVSLTSGGAAVQNGRAVLIDCVSTGTIQFTFIDGSTALIHIQANQVYQFNYALTGVSIGTATATVYNIN